MFTGIIRSIGTVSNIEKVDGVMKITLSTNLKINCNIGDSIAVNGVCLTVTSALDGELSFDAINETLTKTNTDHCKVGDEVNLETALTLQDKLDGHMVQGHVDTIVEVLEINSSEGQTDFTFNLPTDYKKFIVNKGSVCLNGVSLTVSSITDISFGVSIIPHTLENTTFQNLKIGNKVNLEVDLIARYILKINN